MGAVCCYSSISSANDIDELLSQQSIISDNELSEHRAQGTYYSIDDININEVNLNADFNNNTAINSKTGANIVDNSAFSNTSGIATAILNSGNNVLIQNSTFVNVTFE